MDSSKIMVILGVALAISEGLALLPQLKANGILHALIEGLKAILPKKPEA